MKQFTISVFGKEWRVLVGIREELPPCIDGYAGYADFSIRQIGLLEIRDSCDSHDLQDLLERMKETLRHEITHAALFECGLRDNREYNHEQIADWVCINVHYLHWLMLEAEKQLEEGAA